MEAGKEVVLKSVVKPVALGPNGWNGVRVLEDEIMEVPVEVLDAITRRGGGRLDILMNEVGGTVGK